MIFVTDGSEGDSFQQACYTDSTVQYYFGYTVLYCSAKNIILYSILQINFCTVSTASEKNVKMYAVTVCSIL